MLRVASLHNAAGVGAGGGGAAAHPHRASSERAVYCVRMVTMTRLGYESRVYLSFYRFYFFSIDCIIFFQLSFLPMSLAPMEQAFEHGMCSNRGPMCLLCSRTLLLYFA